MRAATGLFPARRLQFSGPGTHPKGSRLGRGDPLLATPLKGAFDCLAGAALLRGRAWHTKGPLNPSRWHRQARHGERTARGRCSEPPDPGPAPDTPLSHRRRLRGDPTPFLCTPLRSLHPPPHSPRFSILDPGGPCQAAPTTPAS